MPTVLTHPVAALALAAWGGLLWKRPWSRSLQDNPADHRESFATKVGPTGFALLATGALCTMLPDADVVTRHIDAPWPADLAHRGLTHSFAFAAVVAAVLAWGARRAWAPVAPFAAFVFLFACTASHGVLDAFTDGGPGIMLGWPFTDARVFFPWRPIEVSPLDADRFFAARGLAVLASELVWIWLPGLLLTGLGVLARRLRSQDGR